MLAYLACSFVPRLQAYAAGYIEGYLQADAIWSVYQNFVYRMLKVRACAFPTVLGFFRASSLVYRASRQRSSWLTGSTRRTNGRATKSTTTGNDKREGARCVFRA